MPPMSNEAFSRVLIDKALEFSGWNLLDPLQVRFELNGATGRADYVLSGQRGPLCVVEAKREDLDPYNPSFTKPHAEGLVNCLAPLSLSPHCNRSWLTGAIARNSPRFISILLLTMKHID